MVVNSLESLGTPAYLYRISKRRSNLETLKRSRSNKSYKRYFICFLSLINLKDHPKLIIFYNFNRVMRERGRFK